MWQRQYLLQAELIDRMCCGEDASVFVNEALVAATPERRQSLRKFSINRKPSSAGFMNPLMALSSPIDEQRTQTDEPATAVATLPPTAVTAAEERELRELVKFDQVGKVSRMAGSCGCFTMCLACKYSTI